MLPRMTGEVALIAGGFILLLIGLIGGGINIYICNIPAVTGRTRGSCSAIGIVLIAAGAFILILQAPQSGTNPAIPAKALASNISVVIQDDFAGDEDHPDLEEEDTLT